MQKLMLHLSWHIAKESYLQQSEKWMIVWFTETKFGINNVCENKQEFLLSVGRRKQRLSQILSASKHLQTTQLRIILPRKYGTYCKKNNFKYNLPKLKKKVSNTRPKSSQKRYTRFIQWEKWQKGSVGLSNGVAGMLL